MSVKYIKSMPRNRESFPNSEPEREERFLLVGEKELRIGDKVCYDNGDGLEKDWILLYFDDKEVRIFKRVGNQTEDFILLGNNKHIQKSLPLNDFVEMQPK
jgi:hypothetical protein